MVMLSILCLGVEFLCCLHLMYVFIFFSSITVTEWSPIGKIAARSASDMFLYYKYLIVNLVFPTSVFGVGISF